jgi:hypothetical protein
MSDEDLVHANTWGSLLSNSDLNSEVFEPTNRYQCKYQDCKKSFKHSQNRSRHYRQDHSSNFPPKKNPTVNFCHNETVNLTEINNQHSNLSRPAATLEIADVINMCESFFNQENTETAIALIKRSRIVQENAIEMRYVCLSIIFNYHSSYCDAFYCTGVQLSPCTIPRSRTPRCTKRRSEQHLTDSRIR